MRSQACGCESVRGEERDGGVRWGRRGVLAMKTTSLSAWQYALLVAGAGPTHIASTYEPKPLHGGAATHADQGSAAAQVQQRWWGDLV
jgi:hypothetical protein